MNKAEITPHGTDVEVDDDDEISVIDLLIVLAKRKKFIVGFPVAVGLISAALSFALPNVYKASTRLLPPQQSQSGAAALLSQLGGAAGAVLGGSALKNPNDMYVGMLQSRTVADRLISRFSLKQAYDLDSQERTRKVLTENTVITSDKDGLLTIVVEDKDQKRVARLANAYVEELLVLTRVLAVTEASQRRLFFERQLELSKNNLATAEIKLKGALDTRGVISVDSESRTLIEMVARLRAQVSAKEIQLNSLRAFVTPNHTDYKRAEEELGSLRGELAKLENGSGNAAANGRGAVDPANFENIKLLRDVKYYQMLYEFLAKQYEAARLDEAKDPSIIQVLDPAVEPERKAKPMRALIVLVSTLLALIGAVVFAFVAEARDRALLSPEKAARWNTLRSYLRLR